MFSLFGARAVAVLLAMMFATSTCQANLRERPYAAMGGDSVIAFLCADNGTFSGMSELAFVQEALIQPEAITSVAYCQLVTFGYLTAAGGRMQPVVVATTGIGSVSASLCTQSLLTSTGLKFDEMVFVGTSGFSPVIGGFLPGTAGGCDVLHQPAPIALGSVCVTSAALSMSCGMCISHAAQYANQTPSECSRPNCHGHLNEAMYGLCTRRAPPTLAAAIAAAHNSVPFPPQPAIIQSGSAQWWAANEAVDHHTRQTPPLVPQLVTNCVEADAHQIWVGAPLDYLCREYSAELLNLSSAAIPCVVAMESTGFLAAVNGFSQYPISAAVVRAASNWDMYPLSNIAADVNASAQWVQNTTYVSEAEHLAFVQATYRFAVQTSNNVVLSYVKNREM